MDIIKESHFCHVIVISIIVDLVSFLLLHGMPIATISMSYLLKNIVSLVCMIYSHSHTSVKISFPLIELVSFVITNSGTDEWIYAHY